MKKPDLRSHTDEVCAHIDAVGESLGDELRQVAATLAALSQKVDQHHGDLKDDIAGVDRRLMRVEAGPARS